MDTIEFMLNQPFFFLQQQQVSSMLFFSNFLFQNWQLLAGKTHSNLHAKNMFFNIFLKTIHKIVKFCHQKKLTSSFIEEVV